VASRSAEAAFWNDRWIETCEVEERLDPCDPGRLDDRLSLRSLEALESRCRKVNFDLPKTA